MTALLHRIPEAGEVLGIGRTKVYELLEAGELASVKIGKRRLIPHESLVAYVARLTDRANAAA